MVAFLLMLLCILDLAIISVSFDVHIIMYYGNKIKY